MGVRTAASRIRKGRRPWPPSMKAAGMGSAKSASAAGRPVPQYEADVGGVPAVVRVVEVDEGSVVSVHTRLAISGPPCSTALRWCGQPRREPDQPMLPSWRGMIECASPGSGSSRRATSWCSPCWLSVSATVETVQLRGRRHSRLACYGCDRANAQVWRRPCVERALTRRREAQEKVPQRGVVAAGYRSRPGALFRTLGLMTR
jgi:hypothetical protein